jgi:hypothetical protein
MHTLCAAARLYGTSFQDSLLDPRPEITIGTYRISPESRPQSIIPPQPPALATLTAKPLINLCIATRCLAGPMIRWTPQRWRESRSLEWDAASPEARTRLRISGRCYAMDALGMEPFPRADTKHPLGTTPVMSVKEVYEDPDKTFVCCHNELN